MTEAGWTELVSCEKAEGRGGIWSLRDGGRSWCVNISCIQILSLGNGFVICFRWSLRLTVCLSRCRSSCTGESRVARSDTDDGEDGGGGHSLCWCGLCWCCWRYAVLLLVLLLLLLLLL